MRWKPRQNSPDVLKSKVLVLPSIRTREGSTARFAFPLTESAKIARVTGT